MKIRVGMPRTNTKSHQRTFYLWSTNLVVVWTVGALLDGGVLLDVADLDADDRVHVEPGELAGLDHGDADLEVLGLQAHRHLVGRFRPLGRKEKKVLFLFLKMQPTSRRVMQIRVCYIFGIYSCFTDPWLALMSIVMNSAMFSLASRYTVPSHFDKWPCP